MYTSYNSHSIRKFSNMYLLIKIKIKFHYLHSTRISCLHWIFLPYPVFKYRPKGNLVPQYTPRHTETHPYYRSKIHEIQRLLNFRVNNNKTWKGKMILAPIIKINNLIRTNPNKTKLDSLSVSLLNITAYWNGNWNLRYIKKFFCIIYCSCRRRLRCYVATKTSNL